MVSQRTFGQMAPMDTGCFEVALDMLKDVIVDHRLPLAVQIMFAARADGGMTPGQVAMTSIDSNSPIRANDMAFKGEQAAFSPLARNVAEDPASFSCCSFGQSPVGAGGMFPGPGYSTSSPNASGYLPTSP